MTEESRCDWCHKCINEVDRLWKAQAVDLEAKLSEARKALSRAEQDRTAAERKKAHYCDEDVPRATAELCKAEVALQEAGRALDGVGDSLVKDKADLKCVEDELCAAEADFKDFQDGVMADFLWLRSHQQSMTN